ncbi:helicase-related protein [Mycolicibacterium fortuitum]|uniref:Helicase domain-containing protein n=1 Tax=Mycolicibacterium fortuitum subsp. fortuitum DSM 46621 = ATCC 6841 = JCM 6387 TaxID=1214102 RepID=K0V3X8_MYCFO|nr:helicase-related protein [Mycolicibacterium fortuitum]AIY48213.1 Superfamily II DNA and RNA helicase [Mycobacterium sp. VKM Ac-1817D]CRL82424.1 helicase domain-containing protein [Mycolicibacter nonchromogenicus]EJZ09508.1 helicase domain-containing protein [Mycolicibacterium fortuitum subsp. fortuitum DSM 46621 = ATCC 6841 = JCM 6387]WEV31861.1 helicase-related protein [Mycolicibacterium fortuitum]CRL58316.1 helicase domain-containing protein [Mycolicibacterium fortuitum subsp. fortuitum D
MSGLEARGIVEAELRRELFGPLGEEVAGTPVDCTSGTITFTTAEESRGQFHDAATKQEILTIGTPLSRYGIGVLHSGGASGGTAIGATGALDGEDVDLTGVPGLATSEDDPSGPPVEIRGSLRQDEADSDDFDLTDANSFKPSAMAMSFQCRVREGGSLRIRVSGAHYEMLVVHIPGLSKPVDWWRRRPFTLVGTIPGSVLRDETNRLKVVPTAPEGDAPGIAPTTRVFSRLVPGADDPELRLVTVAVVNNVVGTGPRSALFQMEFSVTSEGLVIEPYPEVDVPDRDDEEQSIDLLYRNKRTFAIGHGCAAEWDGSPGSAVPFVKAVALPAYEVVSLTPNVYRTDDRGNYLLDAEGRRQAVTVSMKELADGTDKGKQQVENVLRLYGEWIAARTSEIDELPERFRPAATRHMKLAADALERMQEGWELVGSDPTATRAFRWANEAMLYQQVRSNFSLREVERGKDDVLRVKGTHPKPDIPKGRGTWRPFQIAFILATLPELVDPARKTRSLVDLIFFPTGGGKTEAYLGACSISLLARRLRNPDDAGTDTLMRYTLRLLTAQQFLRAASLVCVLEEIRDNNQESLGTSPFGIGIWLGGSSTPNSWKKAVDVLGRLRRNPYEQNLFLLLRCPWCGAQMGTKPKGKGGQDVIGYEQVGQKVVLRCVDSKCRYSRRAGLPIHVVDEDIYTVRPSIVIGTVDKFAMMAWRPEARSLFGFDAQGEREVSPPALIIQDELHLISGPLGSMVGLYEPVIDELCTDRRGEAPLSPKIIASTATIRRYEDQIKGLFGREDVALFPPHGLEEGRSFFAEPARLPSGELEPGRRYLGIMSASLGSTQTVQTRVAAAALQGATKVPEDDRDGYWTNLNFLNSLRELGNTVSLLESDIPDYLTGMVRRDGIDPRWPNRTMELTSRRRSDEIPKAIEQLQVRYLPRQEKQEAIDICLASNIIEVGVDIDRLGLMTIVGQPKTTAQYIQVSGRVGRRADVSPGLVITIYGAAKPRDRSHYERFRTYHQQLYAQVEPTSVTPFATPVLRRALHAAAVAYVRQASPEDLPPYPFPAQEFDAAIQLLRERALIADKGEVPVLDKMAEKRARQWDGWERTQWEANPPPWGDPKQGLMRYAGTLPDLDSKATIWDVPTSMRNVDAECRLAISLAYAYADADTEDGL